MAAAAAAAAAVVPFGPLPLTADGMRARVRSFLFSITGELSRERLARMPGFMSDVRCDCAECVGDTLEYSDDADDARRWYREAVDAHAAERGARGMEVGPDGRLRHTNGHHKFCSVNAKGGQ